MARTSKKSYSRRTRKMRGGRTRSRKMRGGAWNSRDKSGGRSRKMRGGMPYGGPLSPHPFDGQGVGTSGVDLQFVAGNAG